jgi:N-acetylglucosamine kinase-like BadF-type ATPase
MECIAALDGGGSKTECLIATPEGECLAWRRSGPSTTLYVPEDDARAAVEDALHGAMADAGLTEPPVAAGIVLPVGARMAHEIFRRAGLPPERIWGFGEGTACLTVATGGETGLVIMAGTGSFAATIAEGRPVFFSGGMGPLLGDEGSGYAIGLAALKAVAKASDGRRVLPDAPDARPTDLSRRLCEHFGVERPRAIVGKVYVPPLPRHQVAALAPLVSDAAAAGDAVAQAVLRQAAGELAEMARIALQHAGWSNEPFPLVLAGGVLTGSALLRDEVCRLVRQYAPHAEPALMQAPPVVGLGVETIARLQPERRLAARMRLLATFRAVQASAGEGPSEASRAAVP